MHRVSAANELHAMLNADGNHGSLESLVWPMFNSVFSHHSWIHLGLNMYVLYSFAPVCIDNFLGKEQVRI